MHHVFVPKPVVLCNLETGVPFLRHLEDHEKDRATITRTDPQGNKVYLAEDEPWSLWRFLARYIVANPKLGKGDTGAKRAKRIKRAFKEAAPGTWVEIDSDIVEAVREILKDPGDQSAAWLPNVMSQMTDFMEAFREAVEKAPVEGAPPSWYDPG